MNLNENSVSYEVKSNYVYPAQNQDALVVKQSLL